jgi:hypothetical protein
MRVMYRQIQEVPKDMWEKKLDLERRADEAEVRAGHPKPRRYRAMFGGEHSQIRVSEREYESIAEWGRLFEEYFADEELQKLEAERQQYFTWEREELFYVDSDSPTPRWMEIMAENARKNAPQ